MRRPSPHGRRGQALTELVLAIPVLFALFYIVTQGTRILNQAERTEMSLWPVLRADTFDFKHRLSIATVRNQLQATVFPGATVSCQASTSYSPVVSTFSIVAPLMFGMERTATLRVDFKTFLPQPAYNYWIGKCGGIATGKQGVQTKASAQTIQDQL